MPNNSPDTPPRAGYRGSALHFWLNITFIVLAIATIAAYFLAPASVAKPLYYGLGFTAIIIKMVETIIRRMKEKKQ